MEKELKEKNRLIDLIKEQLDDDSKSLIGFLDLEKKDNEIILDLIKENILIFGAFENEDKES